MWGVRTLRELVDIISKGTILGGVTKKNKKILVSNYIKISSAVSVSPISRGSVACEKRMDNSFHLLYRRVEEKIKRKASFLFLLTVFHRALSLYSPLHGQWEIQSVKSALKFIPLAKRAVEGSFFALTCRQIVLAWAWDGQRKRNCTVHEFAHHTAGGGSLCTERCRN